MAIGRRLDSEDAETCRVSMLPFSFGGIQDGFRDFTRRLRVAGHRHPAKCRDSTLSGHYMPFDDWAARPPI